MTQDPYKWAKQRIEHLLGKIGPLHNDQESISPGNIWSVKKILVLDYYLRASQPIFKKYFKEWYYVDTHCGSGLFQTNQGDDDAGVVFPGSPLIAALESCDKPFTRYFLSDADKDAVSTLKNRMKKLGINNDTLYTISVRKFARMSWLLKQMESWNKAFVVNIDPTGFVDLAWSDLERILSIKKADVFVTFMNYGIRLGRPHAQGMDDGRMAATFNRVFGTNKWKACNDNDDLVNLYMQQIRTQKKYVEKLPVFGSRGLEIYQLIFASNNQQGAGRIIDYTKKIADQVTTSMIADAMGVVTHKADDLDRWMGD